MKKYEWFFETKEPHPRMIRVIASSLESARSLAADHLGTKKFKQIKVQSFFEAGSDSITIEEPVEKPKPEEIRPIRWNEVVTDGVSVPWWKLLKEPYPIHHPTEPVSRPLDPEQLKANEEKAINIKAAFEAFQEDMKAGKPLPPVNPTQLKCVREVAQRMVAEHHARGGTGLLGIGIGVYEAECGVEGTDILALMFRSALIDFLMRNGELHEEELTSEMFQAIATIPISNSSRPEISIQKLHEHLARTQEL